MKDVTRARLVEAMESKGRNPTEVAVAAGFSRSYLRDYLNGRAKSLSADNMAAIARELGVTVAWLSGEDGPAPRAGQPEEAPVRRDLPVFGTAAGSLNGAVSMTSDAVDWLNRPPGLRAARDAYALFVTGSSMEPRFMPGDIIFVHPHRPVRRGDNVVVQVQKLEGGETEVWIKEFQRRDSNGDFVMRQFNPPSDITFKTPWVKAVHRVLSTAELLGL